MPAGITPPQVLAFNPSSVPVLDLQVAAAGLTAAQVYDMASNLIRPQLVAVPGVAIPTPYGGTSLNVEIDLDQRKLLAHGLSAVDVGQALKDTKRGAAGRRPEDRRARLHGRDQCKPNCGGQLQQPADQDVRWCNTVMLQRCCLCPPRLAAADQRGAGPRQAGRAD